MNYILNALTTLGKTALIATVLLMGLVYVSQRQTTTTDVRVVARSIVKVLALNEEGGGTGWAVKNNYGKTVIMTNDHVCEAGTDGIVRIQDDDGNTSLKHILERNFERDLCLVEGVEIPTLKLAKGSPGRFDSLVVIGHPQLAPTSRSNGVYLGTGITQIGFAPEKDGSCKRGSEQRQGLFGSFCVLSIEVGFSTAQVYPGNSGSPILNERGEVIGVINSTSQPSYHGAFIPLPYVQEMLAR